MQVYTVVMVTKCDNTLSYPGIVAADKVLAGVRAKALAKQDGFDDAKVVTVRDEGVSVGE